MYVTSGGLVGINTSNPNANLDVYGTISATNFVGDGSGLSGVVAGATDRIVSGTNAATRMVAISSTGYISITQAGANSGWFSPYTGLVTLGVSATGPISGTNGYFSGPVGIGTFPTINMLTVNGASAFYPLGMTAASSLMLQGDTYQGISDVIRFRQGTAAGGGIAFTFFDEPYPPLFLKRNTPSKVSVGIGTATPTATLDVRGTISASDAVQVGSSSLACSGGIAGALRYAGGNIQFCNGASWGNLVGAADAMGDRIVSGSTNAIAHQDRSLTISTAGSQRLMVGENGNVGIGISDPAYRFDVSGSARVGNGSITSGIGLSIDGAAGSVRDFAFRSDNSPRWLMRTDSTAESGSNAGSNFAMTSRADNGAHLANILYVRRSTGNVGLNNTNPLARVDVVGTISASDAIQVGTSTLTCGAGIPGAIRYNGGSLQFCNGTSWTTLGTSAGLTGTGSATAVAFWSGSNALTYSDGFFWDNVNKRLGIGTNTPTTSIYAKSASGIVNPAIGSENDVGVASYFYTARSGNGTYANKTIIENTGQHPILMVGSNVGVGVFSPTATLQVSGTFIVSNTNQAADSPSIYVNAGGLVGVGTSAPETPLHVSVSGSTPAITMQRAGDANAFLSFKSSAGLVGIDGGGSGGYLRAFAGGAERMRITASGNAGIGTITPAISLTVVGEVQVSNSGVVCVSTTRGAIRYAHGTGLQFCNGTTFTTLGTSAGVTGTGSATAVAFWSGSSGLTYDADGFYWDATNNRLGIATNTPSTTIQVSGTALFGPPGAMVGIASGVPSNERGVSLYYDTTKDAALLQAVHQSVAYKPILINYAGGRTGVGMSTSPTATLQVSGTFTVSTSARPASPSLFVSADGRVGIGTTNPMSWFPYGRFEIVDQVEGVYQATSNTASPQVMQVGITNSARVDGAAAVLNLTASDAGGRGEMAFIGVQSVGNGANYAPNIFIGQRVGSSTYEERLRIDYAGRVGINQSTPLARLDVVGTISASDAIQLGQNTIACSTQVSGSIRYNTTSNTVQFCNGTGWMSLASGTTGGASALGALTDVQITNLAGRDYLRYDAGTSKWVNISESAVMSTTTMQAGFPDAIMCTITNPAYGPSYMYKLLGSSYRLINSSFETIWFNTDGSFSSATGITASDCLNKSISELYANGKAFNFIGNAANSGGALGDRITSGTLAMVANSATSYVSLSTNGTTWGYLGNAGSFLPTVTANKVSSTTISGSIIQVGNTGASCSSGISGSIRYSSVSSTLEYCQGTAWVSVGPSSTSVPAFSVNRNGVTQTVSAGATTKILFTNKLYDTQNNFDIANSRFQPTVAGYYYVTASLMCGTSNTRCDLHVKRNSTNTYRSIVNGAQTFNMPLVSGVIYLNGSTDYVEAEGYIEGDTSFNGSSIDTYFTGTLIASGNGSAGGGGSGSSDLAGLTDVQLTNLAARDYLRYDSVSSKWVNISESTVMSATTMVSGWPDAIACTGPTANVFLYLTADDPVNDAVLYEATYSELTETRMYVTFTKSTKSYNSHSSLGSYDCVTGTKSIATLYAEGKAYNFIGNANGSGGALGDRLTSGTLPYAVTVNSATGIISLSTAATTWGYLGSGASFLPAVAANKVSAAAVSGSIIQVGNTGASCTSGISGSIRYSSVSSTMEYCNSTAWVSMGPSDTVPVSFHVTKGGTNQTVTAGVGTFLTWNTEKFDTNNNFSSNRFTPTVRGKYLLTLNVYCSSSAMACNAAILKNGATALGNSQVTGSNQMVASTVIADMNGTTDYVEAIVANYGGTVISGGEGETYFSGVLIGPQASGGGGSDNLGNHTATQDLAMGAYNIIGTGQVSMTNVSATRVHALTDMRVPSISTVASVGPGSDRLVSGSYEVKVVGSGPQTGMSVSGSNPQLVLTPTGAGTAALEVGAGRTSDGYSYVDLVGDTTYPDYGFRLVRGNSGANTNTALYHRGTGGLYILTQDAGEVYLGTNNVTRLSVATNGVISFNSYGAGTLTTNGSGVITASSDERLKNIQGGYTRGLEDLSKIHPITYRWTKKSGFDDGHTYSGFSAQDVRKAIPEAVSEGKDGYLTLSDRPILAASVNAIKELKAQLKAANDNDQMLRDEIDQLRSELRELKQARQ